MGSVEVAIKLAAEFTATSGVPCHCAFVSTGGVCGRQAFTEAEEPLRIDASVLSSQNGYVQCKWVAERLIENAGAKYHSELSKIAEARREAWLRYPAYSIYRPGAVTAHSVTGASNLGDSINRYLIGWSLLGAAPPLDPTARVDMSPVDWNAGAIAGIVLQYIQSTGDVESDNKANVPIFTLDNGLSLPYNDLIALLNTLGRPVRICETYADWLAILIEALAREDSAVASDGSSDSSGTVAYLNPLRGLRGALLAKQPKFGSTGCRKHMALLARKGFPSPLVDERYVGLCLQRFVDLGALPPLKQAIAS